MSVAESNVVDAIAIGQDSRTLIMIITDHLGWESEFEFDHLMILQEKINAYASFIENKQYLDNYPNNEFSYFSIEIHFLYKPNDTCNKFINVVNRQLSEANIEIVPSWPIE